VVGVVTTLLADFVAVITVRMFSGSVDSLTRMHQRLVGTHHLHFANLIVSKNADTKLRERTLAAIATHASVAAPAPVAADAGDKEKATG
jgi:hypothetical protein